MGSDSPHFTQGRYWKPRGAPAHSARPALPTGSQLTRATDSRPKLPRSILTHSLLHQIWETTEFPPDWLRAPSVMHEGSVPWSQHYDSFRCGILTKEKRCGRSAQRQGSPWLLYQMCTQRVCSVVLLRSLCRGYGRGSCRRNRSQRRNTEGTRRYGPLDRAHSSDASCEKPYDQIHN